MERRIIIPKVCSCGNLMGCKAREYENELNKNSENREHQLNVIKKFGWTKTCCRLALINAKVAYIRDSNKNSWYYVNKGNPISKNGVEFVPSKTVPEFPLLKDEEKETIIEEEKEQEIPKNVIKKTLKTK